MPGLVGLAILLPLIFDMDLYAAFAVMICRAAFCFYLSQPRERLWISSTYAIGILGLIVGVFHVILSAPWSEGVFPQAEQLIPRGWNRLCDRERTFDDDRFFTRGCSDDIEIGAEDFSVFHRRGRYRFGVCRHGYCRDCRGGALLQGQDDPFYRRL
ncbi:MAG: hypothetical protein WD688_20470 [Candidatus Binatia bacterium]